MSLSISSSIVTNGLVFHYDMFNPKSYVGPPLTNILPNGINAGYPTYPSGWGTYNTNQYGSGTFFSIGSISGVASNIVTCPNHSLRTYDVVQPQTTGGGVTAGTNYLVRKWDANTFSLYYYDGTQDATNIFDLQSNFNNDTRIAISSGITNMWWGYPHLPNAGIMKRIITNGFNWQGRVHDCLRIHWYRADGVCDGMAYGNYASCTSGITYTISFWARAATPNCIGKNVYCEQYVNGFDTGTTFTLNKNWKNYTITFTPTATGGLNIYWFNSNCPAQCAWDISEIQVYVGTSSSKGYIQSGNTRTNTQAILDLTGNNTITATSLTYASDGTFSFNGSSNYIDCGNSTTLQQSLAITMAAWVYPTSWAGLGNIMCKNTNSGYRFRLDSTAGALWWYVSGNVIQGGNCPLNTWSYCAVTGDSSGLKAYVNGVLVASNSTPFSPTAPTVGNLLVGSYGGAEYFNGKISNATVYNRALSAAEVKQNFSAHRGRYSI